MTYKQNSQLPLSDNVYTFKLKYKKGMAKKKWLAYGERCLDLHIGVGRAVAKLRKTVK